MTPGDELTIHCIDSRDNWRGEVVAATDETVSATLSNGSLLEFSRADGAEVREGKWRLAPKHVRRTR
ncbi:hypothetical protein WMF38_57710 [Sorangium sp. So ce118]